MQMTLNCDYIVFDGSHTDFKLKINCNIYVYIHIIQHNVFISHKSTKTVHKNVENVDKKLICRTRKPLFKGVCKMQTMNTNILIICFSLLCMDIYYK